MTAKLLRVAEAAELLSVSRSEVYKLVSERRLSSVRVGSRVLFTPEHLTEFIEQSTVPAAGGGA